MARGGQVTTVWSACVSLRAVLQRTEVARVQAACRSEAMRAAQRLQARTACGA